MNDPKSCQIPEDDLVELVLGTLTGKDRSEMIEHLEHCERCRAEVAQLTKVTDALLELAPAAEPPVGFEQRVLESLRAPAPAPIRRIRPRPRLWWVAAAAVVAAAAGFTGGALESGGNSSTPPAATAGLTSYTLAAHGEALGRVYVASGSQSWLVMQVDTDGPSEVVRCAVVLAGGRQETVGWFGLRHGYGLWSASIGASSSKVRSVELFAGGRLVASAKVT